LNVLHQSHREISSMLSTKIECRLVSSQPVLESALDLRQPTAVGQVTIGVGAFVRKQGISAGGVPGPLTGPVE
jgi:hypothetical protein